MASKRKGLNTNIMGKFILFGFVLFFVSVVVSIFIVVLLLPLNVPDELIETIVVIAAHLVLGIGYWLFYGKGQLARFREKRAREAALGLERSPIIKKKYAIGIAVIIGTFLLTLLLSAVLNVSTNNTWLGVLSMNIIFVALGVMLFDKANALLMQNNLQIGCLLHFVAFALAASLISMNIITLFFGFPEA